MTDVIVHAKGPFEVSLGPKPRIVCVKCKRPLALRNAPDGVVILECNRPPCIWVNHG